MPLRLSCFSLKSTASISYFLKAGGARSKISFFKEIGLREKDTSRFPSYSEWLLWRNSLVLILSYLHKAIERSETNSSSLSEPSVK
jgi:hypothetical protein